MGKDKPPLSYETRQMLEGLAERAKPRIAQSCVAEVFPGCEDPVGLQWQIEGRIGFKLHYGQNILERGVVIEFYLRPILPSQPRAAELADKTERLADFCARVLEFKDTKWLWIQEDPYNDKIPTVYCWNDRVQGYLRHLQEANEEGAWLRLSPEAQADLGRLLTEAEDLARAVQLAPSPQLKLAPSPHCSSSG